MDDKHHDKMVFQYGSKFLSISSDDVLISFINLSIDEGVPDFSLGIDSAYQVNQHVPLNVIIIISSSP